MDELRLASSISCFIKIGWFVLCCWWVATGARPSSTVETCCRLLPTVDLRVQWQPPLILEKVFSELKERTNEPCI